MNAADFLAGIDPRQIEELYEQYRRDPSSLPSSWALVFAGYELGLAPDKRAGAHAQSEARMGGAELPSGVQASEGEARELTTGINILVQAYRELGHLIANLDPLGDNLTEHPLLRVEEFGFRRNDLGLPVHGGGFRGLESTTLGDLLTALRQTYCRSIGAQYMGIAEKDKRDWLQAQMEPSRNDPKLSKQEKIALYDYLMQTEGFERYLHTKYRGQKRFSVEGGEALIPLLHEMIEVCADAGAEDVVFGMPHRGRLAVLANVLGKPYERMFAEFEGISKPSGWEGAGDVKYHKGYSSDRMTRTGRSVHLSLSNNPSHLEVIYPVVEGIVRAKQANRGDIERNKVVPIVMHGDASVAGQGIVFETLQLSGLKGYTTGGTIHVIVNNQVGFTTNPEESRPSRYASDIARVVQAPVFHVNADDPEAVIQSARLAVKYRQKFKADVFIDLVCYRKHGHNEQDDPTFTQPVMYQKIEKHPSVVELYGARLVAEGVATEAELEQRRTDFRALLDRKCDYARNNMPGEDVQAFTGLWSGFGDRSSQVEPTTTVARKVLVEIAGKLGCVPSEFTAHSKLVKHFDQMLADARSGSNLQWAAGELLAYGSLLLEGIDIRLSGQDVGRGTFTHRHAVLADTRTGARHIPLNHLSAKQARMEIINSNLSEAGVLGFEYGMSIADPRRLVIWEAQFGDFANGAQVLIDQFIASGESKWQRSSGLTLLLPHGYEGQGPEHSSARPERFLQLCAQNNIQVVYPTTPAQIFHLLRRQVHMKLRKPLVVMSPKSLLRLPAAVSSLSEFTDAGFQKLLADPHAPAAKKTQRVILCTGKVYYALAAARVERDADSIAIHRIEQLYPAPVEELQALSELYGDDTEFMWVQEEHWNQGAWWYMREVLAQALPGRSVRYVGRRESASPAAGSYKMHNAEEVEFINEALKKPGSAPSAQRVARAAARKKK